jgi:predicted DNA-binding antitoxin AbrB/MazE fold protein
VTTIEVIYEDNVLKPLTPIKGLREPERLRVIPCPHPATKEGLRELAGTLTHEEAGAMQKFIDEEFERVEGEWGTSIGDNRSPGK